MSSKPVPVKRCLQLPHFSCPFLTLHLKVGDRPDSNVYIGAKVKACEEIGINGVHMKLPPETTQQELIDAIEGLNVDPDVHGIILQVRFFSLGLLDLWPSTLTHLQARNE